MVVERRRAGAASGVCAIGSRRNEGSSRRRETSHRLHTNGIRSSPPRADMRAERLTLPGRAWRAAAASMIATGATDRDPHCSLGAAVQRLQVNESLDIDEPAPNRNLWPRACSSFPPDNGEQIFHRSRVKQIDCPAMAAARPPEARRRARSGAVLKACCSGKKSAIERK